MQDFRAAEKQGQHSFQVCRSAFEKYPVRCSGGHHLSSGVIGGIVGAVIAFVLAIAALALLGKASDSISLLQTLRVLYTCDLSII